MRIGVGGMLRARRPGRLWWGACGAALALLLQGGVLAAGSEPVTVYVNGHIFTAEPQAPYAQALAVRGEQILAVGSRASVTAAAGTDARVVDLQGRFLMPGMIDAHAHPIGSPIAISGGYNLTLASFLDPTPPLSELLSFVSATVKEGTSRMGDVIIVEGIDVGYWSQAAQIDGVLSAGPYATIPIVLLGNDGHTAWGNRVARERAGITAQAIGHMPPAEQLFYGHAANFEPDGFVVDAGLTRLRRSLPDPGPAFALRAGQAAVHYLNALGITGWLDAAAAGVVGGDIPITIDELGALPVYRELARRGELTAHVAAYPVIKPGDGVQQLAVMEALRDKFRDVPNLTMPGVKIFADGVVEYPSQTAVLTKPYRNSGRTAPLCVEPKAFQALVVEADRRGLVVHIHAIGDGAVKASLDAFAAARAANPKGSLPHALTHAQFVTPEDVPRFAQLKVIAALQLLWAVADPSTNEDVKPYIDPSIHATMYPARSLLEAGATIAGASDWPVSTANPFAAIAQAETRTGPQGVLDASQRMPREAMLYAYTRNAARALGQQDSIGSLAPGKRADLVLVDRDVLTATAEEVREAKVVWTMFGGRTVYGTAP